MSVFAQIWIWIAEGAWCRIPGGICSKTDVAFVYLLSIYPLITHLNVRNQISSVGSPLPAYEVTILEDSTAANLSTLSENKLLVVDFWTTKCVKCPAALDKLDIEATRYSNEIKFVSVALSQGVGNVDLVRTLVEE